MEETSGEHLGALWEASGMDLGSIWKSFDNHLGVIWKSFGNHLGSIWDAFGGLEAEEASWRNLEVRSHKLQYLSARMQILH